MKGTHGKGIRARRGAAIVIALITLLVVTLIAATLVQSLLVTHRQGRLNHNELQAEWIAEAAIARATVRLAIEPGYTGETWQVNLAEAGKQADMGEAKISVEKAGSGGRARVIVSAQYPDHPSRRAVANREQIIDLPASTNQRSSQPAETAR